MPVVTLPDGSRREFSNPVSVFDVANDIGPGLAKAALAGVVDGKEVDTSFVIDHDANLAIVTERQPEGLEIIRHSTAHLLAQAVKQLYPGAQVTIGPVIEDGFYYDFAYERQFTPEDLEKIEKRMEELAKEDLPVSRRLLPRDDAVKYFRELGEEYKAEIIASIPTNEDISLYRQGDFEDLCRGPHVPSTGKLKAFKLTKVAGAYWRGDAKNEMLTRVYGTAWANKKELKAYLHRIAEAEKRDHRKLAKKFDLFHIQEEAPGMVFWHPNGWTVYSTIEQYMRNRQRERGYKEIKTPQLVDFSLWQKSGHADKFGDDMFTLESDERQFAIKPMNCPCHVQVFNQGLRSYRDLPLRLAEFGSCHRSEPSGSLHGLMRVRGFVQDDGHIFCTEDQIQSEVSEFMDLLHAVYKDFGFEEVIYRLSTRPEQRVGSDESWDKAEKALADALNAADLPWEELPGEGAFYGPKIEFSLKDCLGRVWQCGTIQVDFSMPGRLDAQYVAEDGSRQTPVMLHRATLGSFERFIGILIENYEGAFPTWLAPQQVAVLNITDRQSEYCRDLEAKLGAEGFRAAADLRNEKIGFKIREHTLQRVPYLLVIGDKEVENQTVAVRTRSGEDLGTMTYESFLELLSQDVDRRGRSSIESATESADA
ncbi:threonine--tRNA ligase [Microbulbifer hydrolyticus]|uniref:Threonine--tRNA ligase n=1 Tax=Microbulbifer hydrolyticus TaxID=48074 RepID=A0A6P1TCC6_9GAMM|nr:threonine--tRNA ligase [Microbulbifer hydrolyticus]MBB5210095.1 threonyl-tRNA synthetase [Microbulbifer hydrolyticus]QHQ39385.1 threonine--tRNA ligase [Microbulbifer hydrolyticus]